MGSSCCGRAGLTPKPNPMGAMPGWGVGEGKEGRAAALGVCMGRGAVVFGWGGSQYDGRGVVKQSVSEGKGAKPGQVALAARVAEVRQSGVCSEGAAELRMR